jgi:hypothetical protein
MTTITAKVATTRRQAESAISANGTGRKPQVRLTNDQQSVDNTARGDGNAEGRQR